MRFTRGLTLGLFLCSLSAGALCADDEIILRGKQKLYGTIKSENGFGVMIEERKELIPASEILDIRYDKRIKEDPSRELYFEARDKEAQVEKSKNPRDSLREPFRPMTPSSTRSPRSTPWPRTAAMSNFASPFCAAAWRRSLTNRRRWP